MKLRLINKPGEVGEIKVALFLFASHSFLVNNVRFMVKLIVKTIVINRKIHKNKRKRFYSSNKEGLICWYKSITANFRKFVLTKFQVNIKGILSTSCVIFSYPKLLSISVLTFIKWRLTLQKIRFFDKKDPKLSLL